MRSYTIGVGPSDGAGEGVLIVGAVGGLVGASVDGAGVGALDAL